MNREIKFRIKNKWNGDWEYFPWNYNESWSCELQNCDESTLGQFTGLVDSAGKKIYEGDVIEQDGHIAIIRCEKWVEFYVEQIKNNPNAVLFDDLVRDFYRIERFRIIGNIYDNPELLKGEVQKIY